MSVVDGGRRTADGGRPDPIASPLDVRLVPQAEISGPHRAAEAICDLEAARIDDAVSHDG